MAGHFIKKWPSQNLNLNRNYLSIDQNTLGTEEFTFLTHFVKDLWLETGRGFRFFSKYRISLRIFYQVNEKIYFLFNLLIKVNTTAYVVH